MKNTLNVNVKCKLHRSERKFMITQFYPNRFGVEFLHSRFAINQNHILKLALLCAHDIDMYQIKSIKSAHHYFHRAMESAIFYRPTDTSSSESRRRRCSHRKRTDRPSLASVDDRVSNCQRMSHFKFNKKTHFMYFSINSEEP